jgi:hypothetical protein
MKRTTLALATALVLLATPALAGKHKGDPVARELNRLEHAVAADTKKIAGIDKKLDKLATKDQTNQKVLDKEAALNARRTTFESVIDALNDAIDALTP